MWPFKRCRHDSMETLTIKPWLGSDWTVQCLCLDCAEVFQIKLKGTRGMEDKLALHAVADRAIKVRGYRPRNSTSDHFDRIGAA